MQHYTQKKIPFTYNVEFHNHESYWGPNLGHQSFWSKKPRWKARRPTWGTLTTGVIISLSIMASVKYNHRRRTSLTGSFLTSTNLLFNKKKKKIFLCLDDLTVARGQSLSTVYPSFSGWTTLQDLIYSILYYDGKYSPCYSSTFLLRSHISRGYSPLSQIHHPRQPCLSWCSVNLRQEGGIKFLW